MRNDEILHIDTDLDLDTDDLCAWAMLLGWPGVTLTGITTVSDFGGLRVGFVRYALRLANRNDIPVEHDWLDAVASLVLA